MKCKKCGKEINLSFFGLPDDICYGCATSKEKDEMIEKNIKTLKREK